MYLKSLSYKILRIKSLCYLRVGAFKQKSYNILKCLHTELVKNPVVTYSVIFGSCWPAKVVFLKMLCWIILYMYKRKNLSIFTFLLFSI